ncbi:hypothetical protein D3C85_909470 [compost metagenome]
MHGQVGIAEAEPGFATELLQCLHEGPGFVTPAPAGFRVDQTGQGVEGGIYIW